MTTLYQLLGVSESATPEQIKAAYRKAARKHHPDKGGDIEHFRKIQKAYDVLSDVARRETYDTTRYIDNSVDNENALLVGELGRVMSDVIDKCTDIDTLDLLGDTSRRLEACLSEGRLLLSRCKKDTERRQQVLDRLSVVRGEGPLVDAIRHQHTLLVERAAKIQSELDKLEAMKSMLEDYDFQFDKARSEDWRYSPFPPQ